MVLICVYQRKTCPEVQAEGSAARKVLVMALIAVSEAQLKVQSAPVAATESSSQPVVTASVTAAVPTVPKSDDKTKPQPSAPFAFADWTWLNGNPRTKDIPVDTKFFTPEIRFDVNYI